MKIKWGQLFCTGWLSILAIVFYSQTPIHESKIERGERQRIPASGELSGHEEKMRRSRYILPLW